MASIDCAKRSKRRRPGGHEILGARGRPKSGRMACRARGGCGTFSDSDHGSATGTVWGSQGKRGRRSGIQRCSDKAYTNWVPQTIQDARAQSGQADPRVSLPEWKAALAAQWFGQKRPTRLPMQRLRFRRQLGSALVPSCEIRRFVMSKLSAGGNLEHKP